MLSMNIATKYNTCFVMNTSHSCASLCEGYQSGLCRRHLIHKLQYCRGFGNDSIVKYLQKCRLDLQLCRFRHITVKFIILI